MAARAAVRPLAGQGVRRRLAELTPPEGVPLHFAVADLGIRIAAQLTDLLLTFGFVVALVVLLAMSGLVGGPGLVLVGALSFFMLRVPYYSITELLWNGQTLGKRICRLRVVSADGRSLSPYSVVVRNLMKEAEVFTPATYLVVGQELGPWAYGIVLAWVAILIAVPLFNRRRQRLGDMIANTCVILQPQAMLLPDLAGAASRGPDARFTFSPQQLDQYGRYELQMLEQYLRFDPLHMSAATQLGRQRTLVAICDKIRAKIGYPEAIRDQDAQAFLVAFYTAQRAYLEQRKLLGDAREDKFHRDAGQPGRSN